MAHPEEERLSVVADLDRAHGVADVFLNDHGLVCIHQAQVEEALRVAGQLDDGVGPAIANGDAHKVDLLGLHLAECHILVVVVDGISECRDVVS